jgi:hypothetical protein
LVLGSWFLVLGSWFLVLGSWFLVLVVLDSCGSWCLVLGDWCIVLKLLDIPGADYAGRKSSNMKMQSVANTARDRPLLNYEGNCFCKVQA